jgi:hypothetical protein
MRWPKEYKKIQEQISGIKKDERALDSNIALSGIHAKKRRFGGGRAEDKSSYL